MAPCVFRACPYNHSRLPVTFQSSVGSRDLRRQFPVAKIGSTYFCICFSSPLPTGHCKDQAPFQIPLILVPQTITSRIPTFPQDAWGPLFSKPKRASLMSGTPSPLFRAPFLPSGLGCQEEAGRFWPLKITNCGAYASLQPQPWNPGAPCRCAPGTSQGPLGWEAKWASETEQPGPRSSAGT